MNVLIIGTTDILGGAAKVSWEIKSALEKRGDKVSMFVADKRSDDKNVHVIPRYKWQKYLGYLLATDSLFSTDWILDTNEFKEADIVHCHNLHGRFFNLKTLEKMSKQKPVVWTLHDEWALTPHCAYTLEGKEMKNGLYVCPSKKTEPKILWDNTKKLAAYKNNIYKNTPLHIVTPSKWLQDRTNMTILKEQGVCLIPNGINTGVFTQGDKQTARQKLNLPTDKKIVMFLATAGKANTWKGWKYTNEVIKQYKDRDDILFLNVGNLVEEEPETNIEYRGHISEESELALYYQAADALLFTSIAENFPLVILEAMSCGLPIVAFNVGGVPEVVSHLHTGFIAQYKNSTEIKEGLEWVLALSTEQSTEVSATAAALIKENYDVSKMTDDYLSLYNEILKNERN